ncbi:hypothetical protein OEZ49_08310 [Ruegeria sp. WL0004]|uniref:Calcium-binding protein n=1 Tax=Ruegeria marisflavi TaxID=2984152 RepID=A0ABT2WPD5_9RHOB|nr:calcium-binding protein [Ruegeria sp. WL0004]MCU9837767.1 hypothetical protein [Ruegeria sp. WL0004]
MATAALSSEFLDLLNRLMTSSDPLGEVLGISLDSLPDVTALGEITGESFSVVSASPSRIEVSHPGPDGQTFSLVVTGVGMGPMTSIEAFMTALGDGTATGTFSGLTLREGTTELLTLTHSAEGLVLRSGTMVITIDGSFPNTLADLAGSLGILNVVNIDALTSASGVPDIFNVIDTAALAALTPAERAALISGLSGVTFEGFTLVDGTDTLASLALSSTGLVLTLADLRFEALVTVPANLGALVEALFEQLDGGADPITGLLTVLNPTDLTLTDGAGAILAAIEGSLGDLGDLVLEIDGVTLPEGAPLLFNIEGVDVELTATDTGSLLIGTSGLDRLTGGIGNDTVIALSSDDFAAGMAGDDDLRGEGGNDRLLGDEGNDRIDGGLGADTLNGGDGDDIIIGGPSEGDLRDIVYAGEGNDSVDAGAGNDLVYGQGGNDTIAGGFGVDEIQGQDGDDVITGSAFSDLVFGGAGNDFVNGGFGHDRINGGSGADKFYHLGIFDHGSDWVQDYNAAEGDVLLFGNAAATRADFQVNFNHTASAEGERAGDDAVQEAFVIYRPTGQIMWALVDGEGQSSINLQVGSDVFDLLT